MSSVFPQIEPYERGMLEVGDGNLVYWETCGNPHGKPALVVHGGPGSGCSTWHRRLFDPAAYRVVLFDQRGCARSTPHAGAPAADLECNTTSKLIEDMEALRRYLQVDRWLVLGGSWGSTLALAYAERHRDRVSELILFGVTTGRHAEFDWLFRGGVAVFFPEQWARLRALLPGSTPDSAVVEGYHHLLHDADPAVRQRAALEWCRWESATLAWPPDTDLSPRFRDLQVRAGVRPSRYPLRSSQRVAGRWQSAAGSGRAGGDSGHTGKRTLRLSGADRQRVGAEPGLATRRARDRGRCRACRRRGDQQTTGSRHRPVRAEPDRCTGYGTTRTRCRHRGVT